MKERKQAEKDIKIGMTVSLMFLGGDYYPQILTGLNKGRYARIIKEAFGESADEIVKNSDIPEMEKIYKIDITNYEAVLIGEFEIWDKGHPRGHSTAYITKATLENGVNVYPILTREGVKKGGVDPDLLKARRYE